MRALEITGPVGRHLRPFLIRLRLKQPGYTQLVNTTVMARNADQARKIVRAQYGDRHVIVGNPREIKS